MAPSSPIRRALVAGSLGAALLGGACARPRPQPQPLLAPDAAALVAPAPDSFVVAFETSAGRFDVLARRHWAPHGVDRFHYLVRHGFYDGVRFFRVVPNFVAQFGMSGDTAVTAAWSERAIPDDTTRATNAKYRLSFASGGPNTRTTQLFINLRDNARLDTLRGHGYPPIGEVIAGRAAVDSLHGGYGEGPPRGQGPSQDSIRRQGNTYLRRAFPALDSVATARVVRTW